MKYQFLFSETLKKLRTQKGLTQEQLANKLDVHYQTVSKWERGVILPDIALFDVLSKEFGVSIDALLGVEDGGAPTNSIFSTQKLATAICDLRKTANLSQSEFADKLGVRADTVSKWERGVICPDILLISNIAQVFQLKVADVYYGNISCTQPEKKDQPKHAKQNNKIKLIAVILTAVLLVVAIVVLIGILPVKNNTTFVFPVENGQVIVHHDDFYHSQTLNTYSPHVGYDIYGKEGAKVYAMFSGTVTEIAEDLLYPYVISITNSDGYTAIYKYVLVDSSLKVGDTVKIGQQIGVVNSGDVGAEARWEAGCSHNQLDVDTLNSNTYPSHIHIELYLNGVMVNSIDNLFK